MMVNEEKYMDERTLTFQEIITKEIEMVKRNKWLTDHEREIKILKLKNTKEHQ